MHIPQGSSEARVLETIEEVVKVLAPQFKIPGFGVEDVAQEARCFAMEALPRFDSTRPLAGFIFCHCRLRLINLYRNMVRRSDAPCPSCRKKEPHQWTNRCKTHEAWVRRNDRKAALMMTPNVADAPELGGTGNPTVETVEVDEMVALIDENLDVELRSTYLRMRAGGGNSVSKVLRKAVEDAVRAILKMDDDG
jgi:DNA-directed RNA polymerase specialized sigma24 family protein